jgi:hypothetical protein
MSMLSRPATSAGEPAGVAALPMPPELPEGLPARLRVLELINADAISWGVAGSSASGRASDLQVRRCLDIAQATARAMDTEARVRCAASERTAAHHKDIVSTTANATWLLRRGRDEANQVLLEELDDLINARLLTTGPHRPPSASLADLVILVAADRVYAPAVRRLRLLQIPTWLLVPCRFVSDALCRCSCAVSFLDPHTGNGRLIPRPRVPSLPPGTEAVNMFEVPSESLLSSRTQGPGALSNLAAQVQPICSPGRLGKFASLGTMPTRWSDAWPDDS